MIAGDKACSRVNGLKMQFHSLEPELHCTTTFLHLKLSRPKLLLPAPPAVLPMFLPTPPCVLSRASSSWHLYLPFLLQFATQRHETILQNNKIMQCVLSLWCCLFVFNCEVNATFLPPKIRPVRISRVQYLSPRWPHLDHFTMETFHNLFYIVLSFT